jgi:hypothetical protein
MFHKVAIAVLIGFAQLTTATVAVGQEKWAAIVGSSDRSAIGSATGQSSKVKAIGVATADCKTTASTSKSCDTVRTTWSDAKCETITIRGKQKSVCNK